MTYVTQTMILTDAAVQAMIAAAIKAAHATGRAQCIVIVDASGETLASFRMQGAKFLSLRSARAKARTAAANDGPSSGVPEAMRAMLAAATQGEVTGLSGGLPIRLEGVLLGGIGIGSGSAEQDVAVAEAALAAIGATI